jgi:predicted  nucleic acid-binding Zn-ribbon protein
MAPETSNSRLERMEEKLDKLSEAIVALARVEEKISNLEHTNSALMKQIISIEERSHRNEDNINSIKFAQAKDSDTLQGLRKFFWMFVSSILGAGFLVWFTVLATHSAPK